MEPSAACGWVVGLMSARQRSLYTSACPRPLVERWNYSIMLLKLDEYKLKQIVE